VASGTSIETDFLKVKSDVDGLYADFGGFQTVNSLKKGFSDLKLQLVTSNTNGAFSNALKYLYSLIVKLDQGVLTDPTIQNYRSNLIGDVSLIRAIKNMYRFKGLSAVAGYTAATGWPSANSVSVSWFTEIGDT